MKQGLIILAVIAFVSLSVTLVVWAHSSPTPQAFVVGEPPSEPTTTAAFAAPEPAAASTTPRGAAFKSTMTTYFFVGEPADSSNDFIANDQSYWDDSWQKHFGGVDDPQDRCGYRPCGFTPKENPFYAALPYGEYDPQGDMKASAEQVPWYQPKLSPLLKNHWIEIQHAGHTCFAQWEDVGPNNEDDFAYVFGSAPNPVNTFGEKAGLDVSPAVWDCLGMTDNDITSWRFVDASEVSDGPWKDIITSSGISWTD